MKWYRRRIGCFLAGLLAAIGSLFPAVRPAEAVDAWAAAAQALGVLAAYQSSLQSILALGNNVDAQLAGRAQDLKENGRDENQNDLEVVDRVMNRLVNQGQYILKPNSLPFLWSVNDSPLFNAACYPTNYISINRGLVRGLNGDEDELAAVLAHEMVHGIEQHSARNYAKAVAQYLGMSFLNMDAGLMDWNQLNGIVDYSIAKNVTLPTEYEADEGGFYLMVSAGFNPGGPAAAMARMTHYFRYETTDFWEYDLQDPDEAKKENFNDHPETERREARLAKMLTRYSCGHVEVRNGKEVYVHGRLLCSAVPTRDDYDNRTENAYYIAGGLAKAFHDYETIDEWNFRTRPDGKDDLLTDDPCYRSLRETVARLRLGAKLKELVAIAYELEPESGGRHFLRQAEQSRMEAWESRRQEALNAKPNLVQQLRINGDTYNDYGMGDYALMELSRAFASHHMDDPAESCAIRGRAKAICGDFEGALLDADQAVEMDSSNPYNFLNRADVRHMEGNMDAALQDVASALALDPENAIAFHMQGKLWDELGQREAAQESFKACYRITRNPKSVPPDYLEAIDAHAYARLKKEEARREKEREEAEREKRAAEEKRAAKQKKEEKAEKEKSVEKKSEGAEQREEN